MTAQWQSSIHLIVAALGLFLINASSPKDFPLRRDTTSTNRGSCSCSWSSGFTFLFRSFLEFLGFLWVSGSDSSRLSSSTSISGSSSAEILLSIDNLFWSLLDFSSSACLANCYYLSISSYSFYLNSANRFPNSLTSGLGIMTPTVPYSNI
jgi:hypothetical protein